MRVYTVHDRPSSPEPDREIVLVKEGFCWPAVFLTVLWALWHRMWLVAILMAAADVAVEIVLLLTGADDIVRIACLAGVSVIIGYGANDWRRAKLARDGYREAAVIAAHDGDSAYRRFFDLYPDPPSAGAPAPLF